MAISFGLQRKHKAFNSAYMKKKSKRSKIQEEAMSKYLTEKFAALNAELELIPVVMQRGQWEALKYTIDLALTLTKKST